MTNSQSCSSLGSSRPWASAWLQALHVMSRWQERRRARAELGRLAQVGDYLLRDVGLDPEIVRKDPSAAAARFLRR